MRLTGLADRLRTWGLNVVEDPGWQSRGADFPSRPHVVVAHHTGTPQSAPGDYPTLHIVRSGRSDLPGPLCQVGIGRSGTVYVIAAGKANHAGKGAWRGHTVGNSDSVGIEAESPGDGHWTPAQRRVYPIVCAAFHDLLETSADLTCGHRESALPAGRKVDPVGIDMDVMRGQVAQLLRHGPPTVHAHTTSRPATLLEESDMHLIHSPSHSQTLVAANGKGGLTLTKLTTGQAKTLAKTLRSIELTDAEYADYMALKSATAS